MNDHQSLEIRCPSCGADFTIAWRLPQDGAKRCPRCKAEYPIIHGILDLRGELARKRQRGRETWDLDAFDRGYEQAGHYQDNWEHARRSRVPECLERFRYPRIKGWIVGHMPLRASGLYLDVGCGVGMMFFKLKQQHPDLDFRFVGIEVSVPHLLPLARRVHEEGIDAVLPIAGDGERLPFPANIFDGVICTEVLEHILDKERAIGEMARVLKPGGELFLTTPSRLAVDFWNAAFWLPRRVHRVLNGKSWRVLEQGPFDEPITPFGLARLLARAGLRPREFRSTVVVPHESYFQFFPAAMSRGIVQAAKVAEDILGAGRAWMGLHLLAAARKPKPAAHRRSRRVLYVIDDLNIGGTETMLARVIQHMDRRRCQPHVVTLFGLGPIADVLSDMGVPVECLGLGKLNLPLKLAALAHRIRREHYDVVHCFRVAGRVFGALAAADRHPVICRWGSVPSLGTARWRWAERFTMRMGAHMEACSEAVADDVAELYRIDRPRVHVLHNGIELWDVDALPTARQARKLLGLPARGPVVGAVGNLNWRKDYPTLIRASVLVLEHQPHAVFIAVGHGPDRGKLEALTHELGVADHWRFLGRRDDVPVVLRALDVFAMASLTEGTANALIEAMWSRVPSVATRVGGIPEVTDRGRLARLCEARSPERLAANIVELLESPHERDALAEAAHEWVLKEFSIEKMVRRIEQKYDALTL